MKKNMGNSDKIIRLVLGLIILLVGLLTNSWWGLLGIIPILTSLTSFCPLYVPLKLSTLKKKDT